MIFGDIGSLDTSVMLELEKLHGLTIAKNDFLPDYLVIKLSELTALINNEIAVYLTRKGQVMGIVVGNHSDTTIPELSKHQHLLSGIRCIHTHITEDGRLSQEDIDALVSQKLDGMISIGTQDGKYTNIMVAIPTIGSNFAIEKADLFGPFKLGEKNFAIVFRLIDEIDICLRATPSRHKTEIEQENAILIGLNITSAKNDFGVSAAHSLYGLEQIARNAGAQVLEKLILTANTPDPEYYTDFSTVAEIALLCQLLKPTIIVIDAELSGCQLRNLEKALKTKVIDKSLIILDVLANKAKTQQSKIQVELTQLKYILPLLTGTELHLASFNKGIGARTPDGHNLESNKESIISRIKLLTEELEEIAHKDNYPKKNRRRLPLVALIGYINSGKTTLLNALANLNESSEIETFSTVNENASKISLPNGEQVTVIDTMDFIKDLSPALKEAFTSTLDEIAYADVIIHVVDSSAPSKDISAAIANVNLFLNDIGAAQKPMIVAFNKANANPEHKHYSVLHQVQNCLEISVEQKDTLDNLLNMIIKLLF